MERPGNGGDRYDGKGGWGGEYGRGGGAGWESRRANELPRIRGRRGKMIERGGGAQRRSRLVDNN